MEEDQDHALTEKVIGLAMKIHRTLGPGFLESVYRNALAFELRRAGLAVDLDKRITVRYENVIVGDFVADIVVNETLICELKAISTLTKRDEVQVVNYLAATNHDVGLLLNFRKAKIGVLRRLDQAAAPAACPDAHAHWKLYPPSQPVTSTASPMKKRPGTLAAAIVLEERPRVSTPPSVTSALL